MTARRTWGILAWLAAVAACADPLVPGFHPGVAVDLGRSSVLLSRTSVAAGERGALLVYLVDGDGHPFDDGRLAIALDDEGLGDALAVEDAERLGDGRYRIAFTALRPGTFSGLAVRVGAGRLPGAAPLQVAPATLSAAASEIRATPASLPSGAQGIIEVLPRDALGNPVVLAGDAVRVTAAGEAGQSSVDLGAPAADANGTLRLPFVAVRAGGALAVGASLDGMMLAPVAGLATITVLPGPVDELQVTSGDGQAAEAGGTVAQPMALRARDAAGNAVVGLPLRWQADGGAEVVDGSVATDEQGGAQAGLRLGPLAGRVSVLASAAPLGHAADDDAATARFAINAVARLPRPTSGTLATTGPAVADGRDVVAITVSLADDASDPVAGVVPVLSVGGSGNHLASCPATDLAGHSACALASQVAEVKTVRIAAPPVAAASVDVQFVAGPPSPQTSSWTVPSAPTLADDVAVAPWRLDLRDAAGNAIAGLPAASLQVGCAGQGCTVVPATGVSDAGGSLGGGVRGRAAGTVVLSVVGPAPLEQMAPAQLAFSTWPATGVRWALGPAAGTAGVGLGPIELALVDAAGRVVALGPDSAVEVAVELAAGGGQLRGASRRAATGGRANFSGVGLTLDRAGSGKVLRARATSTAGALSATSAPFPLAVGAAAALRFADDPAGGQAGRLWPQPPQVRIEDLGGNLVASGSDAGASIALRLVDASGEPSAIAVSGSTAACSAGMATFSGLRVDGSADGLRWLAEAALTGGAARATSAPFSVLPGPAAALVWRWPGLSDLQATVPWASGPQLLLRNAVGELVTTGVDAGAGVTLAVATGSATLAGASAVAAVGGVADFAAAPPALHGLGSVTLRATKAATAGSEGSGALAADLTVNVVPGPAAALRWAQAPQPATAGAAWSPAPVALVVDGDGNVVVAGADAGAALSATLASGAALTGTTAATCAAGRGTFSGLVVAQAGSVRLRVDKADTTADGGTQALTLVSAPVVVAPGPPAGLAIVAAPTSAAAGVAWDPAPQVQLVDANGNAVVAGPGSDAVVTLSPGAGSGALTGTLSRAAVAGLASFPGIATTLAAENQRWRAQATLGGSGQQVVSGPLSVGPGPALALSFLVQPAGVVAGAPWGQAPVLRLADAWNNTAAAGSDATALVTLSLTAGVGPLQGPVAKSAWGGLADFAGEPLGLGSAGAGRRLAATAAAAAGTLSAMSDPFVVAAGAAAGLAFAASPGSAVAGAGWATAPAVLVIDADGNPVTGGADAGRAVTLSLLAPVGAKAATLLGTVTAMASAGRADFAGISPPRAGSGWRLRAEATLAAGPASATSAAFAVAAGPVAEVRWVAQPPAQVVSQASWQPAPRVCLLDAQGNLVDTGPDATADIALALTQGSGTLAGSAHRAATAGCADFAGANLAVDLAGGDKVLRATKADTSAGGGSAAQVADAGPFAVVAGPASQLAFATSPTGGVAGAAFPVQPRVEVRDAAGNVVDRGPDAAAVVTVQWQGGDAEGALTGSRQVAAAGGVATFAGLAGAQAGAHRLVADKATTAAALANGVRGSGPLAAVSPSFSLGPGDAAAIALAVCPAGAQQAGAPLAPAPEVQLRDAWGNDVAAGPDATATVALTAGSGGLAGTASVAAVAGRASFPSLAAQRATSAQTLLASATVAGQAVSASCGPFEVRPGPAAALALTRVPAAATAGSPIMPTPAVAVLDAQGNQVDRGPDAVRAVALSLAGGAPLGGDTVVAAEGGLADFQGAGLQTTVAQAAARLVAQAAAGGPLAAATSAAFPVAAGQAARLAFVDQPSGGAAMVPWSTQPAVQVQDLWGNPVTTGADAAVVVSLAASGGGPLTGTSSQAATAGLASFAGLGQPIAAAGLTLVARATFAAGDGAEATSAAYAISPGAAAAVAFLLPPPAQVVALVPWWSGPQVAVVDGAGNLVDSGPDASAAIALTLVGGAGTLGGTTVRSAAAGLADFAGAGLTLDVAGAGRVLRAEKADTRGAGGTDAVHVDAAAVSVVHGAAAALSVVVQPGDGAALSPLPAAAVQAVDAAGNAVTGGVDATATLSASLAAGTLAGGSALAVAAAGQASFPGLTVARAGSYTLRFSKPDTRATVGVDDRRGSGALTAVSAPFMVTAGPASGLAFAGQPGGGVAGVVWASQPAVQVVDAAGNPVTSGGDAGVTVTVEGADGGPAPLPAAAAAQAASLGLASFAGLRAERAGAAVQLVARANLAAGAAWARSAPFAVAGGPAAALAFRIQPGGGAAGTPWPQQPQLALLDAYGNLTEDAADAGAMVSLAAAAGQGPLAGTPTVAAAGGVADFAGAALALGLPGDGRLLTAQAAGSLGTLAATSAPFAVGPAGDVHLVFAAQPGGAVAGTPWLQQPVVEVRDQAGHLVDSGPDASAVVSLAPAAGTGALTGTTTVAASGGVATFAGVATQQAGTGAVVATAETSAGRQQASSSAVAVAPGAAASLAFAQQPPAQVAAMAPWAAAPRVVVLDAYGNRVTASPDATATVALSLAVGAGPLGGSGLSQAASSGSADFAASALRLGVAGPGNVLRATKADTTGAGGTAALQVDARPVTVVAGAAAQLAFVAGPGGGTAGTPWAQQPSVAVLDGAGNPVTIGSDATAAVTLSPAAGSGPLLGTASVAASAGLASFAGLHIDRAGSHALVARKGRTTDTVAAGVRGSGELSASSAVFAVAAAAAGQLSFALAPVGGQAGVTWAQQPQVVILDPYGNLVATGVDAAASVALSVAAGPGPLVGTTSQAASAGVCAFSGLRIDRAAAGYRLAAQASLGAGPCVATTSPFAVVSSAAATLAFAVSPGGGIASVAWPQQPRVEVRDAYGNVAGDGSDSTVPVTLTLSGGSGMLAGASRLRAVAGSADFATAGLAVDVAGADKVLTAAATLAGPGAVAVTSPVFPVSHGPAARLSFSVQPGGGVAGTVWGQQPQVWVVDAQGNVVSDGPDAAAWISLGHPAGGGTLAGATTVQAAGGIATFSGLSLDAAGGQHRLVASKSDTSTSAGGTAALADNASSPSFSVVAAAAAAVAFLDAPKDGTAGLTFSGQPLRVSVNDAFGNRVASGPGSTAFITLALASGSGTLAGATAQPAAAGVATFSGLSVAAAGSKTLAASATLGGSPAAATTVPFTISPATASQLAFSVQPAGSTSYAALPTQPEVVVQDAFGNLVASGPGSDATITLSVPAGQGVLLGTLGMTSVAGRAAFAGLRGDVPGTKTLVARALLPGGLAQATSATFSVAAGPAFTQSWPFDAGTASSYAVASQLTFSGGTVSLTAADQADQSAAQFGAGSAAGVGYDSGGFLRLDNTGGCNALTTNCAELDSSWTPRWTELLGYYRFNGTGNIANGASIAGVVGPNLTAYNANGTGMQYVAGHLGQAISLDGVDDWISLPASLGGGANGFTFAGWVRFPTLPDSSGVPRIFEFTRAPLSNVDSYFSVGCNAGQVSVTYRPSYSQSVGFSSAAQTVFFGSWAHVAVVSSGATVSFYMNGVLTGVNLAAIIPTAASYDTGHIGYKIRRTDGSTASYMRADIDEYAFWSAPLTAQEIAHIYARQSAVKAGSLVSRVFDGTDDGQAWNKLAWSTTRPYMKKLSDGGVSETATSYVAQPAGLQANVAAVYHFTEGDLNAGTNYEFSDGSGQANHGVWQPGATSGFFLFQPVGVFGRSIGLIGNTYATTLVKAAIPSALSVQAWFYPTANTGQGPVFGLSTIPASDTNRNVLIYPTDNANMIFAAQDAGGTIHAIESASPLVDPRWHHAVGVLGPSGMVFYMDGKVVGTDALTAAKPMGSVGPAFGYVTNDSSFTTTWPKATGKFFSGRLNEAGMWNRELSQAEVLALYRRGANRIRFQVRSCQQPGCADNPGWQGPDGSNQSYYSELNNVSGTGAVLATAPNVDIAVPVGRYFQYRAFLESDDQQSLCSYPSLGGAAACSPELISVTPGPTHYSKSAPTVANVGSNTHAYAQLTGVSATLGAGGCPGGVTLTLSPDGSHWYRWDGASWSASNNSRAQSTSLAALTPAVMAAFAPAAGAGQIFFTAFLNSDGVQPCVLDQITVTGTN